MVVRGGVVVVRGGGVVVQGVVVRGGEVVVRKRGGRQGGQKGKKGNEGEVNAMRNINYFLYSMYRTSSQIRRSQELVGLILAGSNIFEYLLCVSYDMIRTPFPRCL